MKKLIFLTFVLAFALAIPLAALAQTEVPMSPQEKKKLDTFFSNFSEADVKNFTPDTISDALLLNFALAHNYKNNFKALKRSKDNLSVVIPDDLVDKTTEKYFGKKVSLHRSKSYTVPMADGEGYVFSQIRELTKSGDGTFEAKGVVFSASSGFTGDPHGTPADWKKTGEEAEPIGKFVGIMRQSRAHSDRYVLIRYTFSANKAGKK